MLRGIVRLASFLLVPLTALDPAVVSAQAAWTCVTPADPGAGKDCSVVPRDSIAGTAQPTLVVLRLANGARGEGPTAVSVKPEPAYASYLRPAPANTDSDGFYSFEWRGLVPKDVAVTVVAEQLTNKPSRVVIMKAVQPALTLGALEGEHQSWFVGKLLRDTIRVEIREIGGTNNGKVTSAGQCGAATVVFRALHEAEVAIDSVRGSLRNGGCWASTRWRLAPDRVGEQKLSIALGTSRRTVSANARALPRLAVAIGGLQRREHQVLAVRQDTVEVERSIDGTTVTFDSIISSNPRVVDAGGKTEVVPVLAIDFPIWPTVDRVRFSVGANLERIEEEFLVGVSIFQFFRGFKGSGLEQEDMGWDFHFVTSFARPNRLVASEQCRSEVAGFPRDADVSSMLAGLRGPGSPCETKDTVRLDSVGILLVTDAGQVIEKLGKVLGF